MNNYIRYYDPRFGDIYEIFVDHDGEFVSARRSMETLGQDCLYYDDIEHIPSAHRNDIEACIAERKKIK